MEEVTEVDSAEAAAAVRIAGRLAGGEAGGHAEAELYRLLSPRVRRYGMRHLRDSEAAADLVQQVMTLTLESLRAGRLREPARVLSFVLGACRLTVRDQRRRERRREDLLLRYGNELASGEPPDAQGMDLQRVVDCLQRLPERERSVLVMTFYDDQPADFIAAQLSLSSGNVRVIRHRGIGRLRRCVGAGKALA